MSQDTETTYFITGVNRGIGRELVTQLLESDQNNRVIGTMRKQYTEDSELKITKDPRLTILRLDYNDTDTYISVARELERLNLGIDVFISNAAVNTAKGNVLESSPEEYMKYFKINAIGPIEILKVLKPFILKKKTRKIVFTTSVLGSVGDFPQFLSEAFPCAPYGVSKAALNSLGVQLSHELKDEGFIVVNYHPGLIATKEKGSNDDVSQKKGFKADKNFLEYIIDNSFGITEGVKRELKIIKWLKPEDNGKFLTHDGSELKY